MILYQNALIKLDYTPSTDILDVEWPNFQPYSITEVKVTLEKLIDAIRSYDIKNLLIDSSNTSIDVTDKEYDILVDKFMADLLKTRLQKIARINSNDIQRENKAKEKGSLLPINLQLESFSNKTDAINWLMDKNNKIAS